MLELNAVYAIWLREIKVYLREKERVISSIVSPILWLFVFGSGIGETTYPGTSNYQAFILPGILVMSVLFVSVFYGLYIIWDRRLDFLKEVLVAPVSRASIFLGKVLGGVSDAMLQAVILLVIGTLLIIPLEPIRILYILLILTLISFSTASMGLVLGANMRSQEGFILIINFVMWPMFFFSGALFPISNLPEVIRPISTVDPLTYAVDALRTIFFGTGAFPFYIDIVVLLAFAAVTAILGVISFGNLQQAK
ncbi:ABC transporter permease [Candidatus Micrarchaeota archaeon]|nr:ABC transporter permease [Candidatus Micrarchaeota archaeon]